MNKQRRLGRSLSKKYDLDTKTIFDKGKKLDEKTRVNLMRNRSCYFGPDLKDAEQLTDYEVNEEYQEQISDRNGKSCLSKETIEFIKELKKILYVSHKETSLQNDLVDNLQGEFIKKLNLSNLQDNDSVNEIYKLVNYDEINNQPTEKQTAPLKNIHIFSEPRIKVIAEKFSRYRKGNVEVRRLEERVVCIEYDVYESGVDGPARRLRAYFTIRPVVGKENVLPSDILHDYNVTDEELRNVSGKGIEIIDAGLPENKRYLEGLRVVLKRQHCTDYRKDKTFLDPMNLYRLAKRNSVLNNSYSYTNFLSKEELEEIKDLIMKKTTSSVRGISRRKLSDGDKVMFGKDKVGDRKTTIEEIFRDM